MRIITIFFVIALLWASFGSVDIIATATGKIVAVGGTKVIQPLESGVVRAIHVHDGQIVKAGDILIEIDSTINESEHKRLIKEYNTAQLDMQRLRAALDLTRNGDYTFSIPDEATAEQIQIAKMQLNNQRQEIDSKLNSLDQQIVQHQGNLVAVQATISKLTQSIPFLEKRAAARKYLFNKGYGSKLEYLASQQDLVEHQQDLEVQRGRLTEAMAQVSALEQQRKQVEAEYHYTTSKDLALAIDKASSLKEQVVQASQKFKLQTLTAPVNGTVQQLAVHTEGGVVTPAQALLSIVPEDSHPEIEAMIANRDIGFVHSGQEAEIKIDTFDFTKYGLMHGRVVSISQDSIVQHDPTQSKPLEGGTDSSEPAGQQLLYSARVSLDETLMRVEDKMVNLTPGMAVTVEIKTGSRSVISYLLSPIEKHTQQALRER
jgi:hemolysin D